uniref:Uncharacterized protein n=1 Tax=Paracalanus parvus TaxID=187406 RepID=A0A0U2UH76_9MAXI|nr:hypothetical protein [Paracalanus parvus]
MLSFGRIFQLMLMIVLIAFPTVFPLSIVKYVPMEEESYTNTVYRKAYNLVPGLKRLRAKSPAEGRDFVSAVVTGLSTEFVGTGVVASSVIGLTSWILSSISHLIPIEVVEWMLGRKLIMQDVMNLEILVRDVVAIYAAWTR